MNNDEDKFNEWAVIILVFAAALFIRYLSQYISVDISLIDTP